MSATAACLCSNWTLVSVESCWQERRRGNRSELGNGSVCGGGSRIPCTATTIVVVVLVVQGSGRNDDDDDDEEHRVWTITERLGATRK